MLIPSCQIWHFHFKFRLERDPIKVPIIQASLFLLLKLVRYYLAVIIRYYCYYWLKSNCNKSTPFPLAVPSYGPSQQPQIFRTLLKIWAVPIRAPFYNVPTWPSTQFGWEPTMWSANNCLQTYKISVLLQIIFCSKLCNWNHALAWKCQFAFLGFQKVI